MKSDPYNKKSFSAKARAQRAQMFGRYATQCNITNATVLDIGGTMAYWKNNLQYIPQGLIKDIDVINLPPQETVEEKIGPVTLFQYAGDATDLSSLRLDHYDIVYSNSVLEHVGTLRNQKYMAEMVMKLGDYYFIQTPAKSFPIEPHFFFPFFAYLPLGTQAFLHQNFHLGFLHKNPDWLSARIVCEETRLITYRELKTIFKGCDIIKERLFGLCKSYIATNMMRP